MYLRECRNKPCNLSKFGITIELAPMAVVRLEGENILAAKHAVDEGFVIEVEPIYGKYGKILEYREK